MDNNYEERLSVPLNEEEKIRLREIERSIIKKYRPELWSQFTKAINKYELIEEGDRIAVCISGGKDSMLMAKLFQELYRHGRHNFELKFLVMNPGYNEENYRNIVENARLLQLPVEIFSTEIFDIAYKEEMSPCYLCARMRRGALYSQAKKMGCNKIALGHHFDDVIETLFMGIMYSGQYQGMMPKLHSTNFEGMELIRPLYLIREEDIIRWAKVNDLKFLRCACRFTENLENGDLEKSGKRKETKELIRKLHETNPYIEANIFKSVENVHLNTVICYKTSDGVKHNFLDNYHDRGKDN